MIPFYKLTGGGNDFLALVECESEPTADQIRAWCSRGVSIGADGVFLLHREDRGARMTYFNADGGRAHLCLNGTRCAALLALELSWAEEALVVETDAGPISARSGARGGIELLLPKPVPDPQPRALTAGGVRHHGWSVDVGVPHFVLEWPGGLASAPVLELGRELRSHPDLGAPGANIHFVRFTAPASFEIRSFERGVEAETLACGTGVVAAAAVGRTKGELGLPASALTRGGSLFEVAQEDERWRLGGDARIVARGELADGAAQVPAPAAWS